MSSDLSVLVEGLEKRFRSLYAIKDLSFCLKKGQVLGFLGPNGAGKSTTMRIICGVIAATKGIVEVCGYPITTHPQEVQKRIGFMPEQNPLPEDMKVEEYLKYRGKLKGLSSSECKSRVSKVMEMCELDRGKTPRSHIHTLSKGFRQRVGVADAVLANPELVILDEPTIGLDPHQVINFRNLIASLRGEMSVIVSSHILEEVEKCCDRVLIVNHGQPIAQGTHRELTKEFFENQRFWIEIKGNQTNLPKILLALNLEIIPETPLQNMSDGFFRVFVQSSSVEEQRSLIWEFFKKTQNWDIREVSLWQPTLEEIFLAATQKSWKHFTFSKSKDPWKIKTKLGGKERHS